MKIQSITPFLWFDHQAEQAARFYVSVFRDAELRNITRYPEGTPGPAGSVMTVTFRLRGQDFIALNGGPDYKITPAVSFVVSCKTQDEIDYYWAALTEGGRPVQCGWLEDKFGVSWQIVPTLFDELAAEPDPTRFNRMMHAVLQMEKLDLKKLEAARDRT